MSKKLTIEQMQELAKVRGGQCLSKKYINNKTKLTWQCKEGHVWEARSDKITIGQWCPYCAGRAKLTIGAMQKLAKSKEGKCLSKIYVNNRTKLKWKCKEGHEWETTPTTIQSGTWCPYCARNVRLSMSLALNFLHATSI